MEYSMGVFINHLISLIFNITKIILSFIEENLKF